MPTWPASLVISRTGFKESLANNSMRSKMETGPEKVRRRTTANSYPVSFNLFLNDDQLEDLKEFYNVETYSGSIQFDFINPSNGQALTARFSETPPSWTPNADNWDASVSLEILP